MTAIEKVQEYVRVTFGGDYAKAWTHYAGELDRIDKSKLAEVLEDAGVGNRWTRPVMVRLAFSHIDGNGDGIISRAEFDAVVNPPAKGADSGTERETVTGQVESLTELPGYGGWVVVTVIVDEMGTTRDVVLDVSAERTTVAGRLVPHIGMLATWFGVYPVVQVTLYPDAEQFRMAEVAEFTAISE